MDGDLPPTIAERAAGPDVGSSDPRADWAARIADDLSRARSGELGALDGIVRELNPLLWHVARSQGLDSIEAADVVQTAWLELVGRLDVIRTPAALPGWLITVTKRESWRVSRQRRKTLATELPDLPDESEAIDHRLLTDQRDRVLWRCFQQLSARCRQLLRVVAAVDRPDYGQISEAMGMPLGSIGPTRGRCLTKLRELLTADPAWARS